MKELIIPLTELSEIYQELSDAGEVDSDFYCRSSCKACHFDWALREWVWETEFFQQHMSDDMVSGWITVTACPRCGTRLGTNEETGLPYRSFIVE